MPPSDFVDLEPLPLRLGSLGWLKSMLEDGDWPGLRQALAGLELWVFDRPLAAEEGVDALESFLADAADRRLLVTALQSQNRHEDSVRSTFTCCLMWGEPASWREHEYEFDLHLGSSGRPGAFAIDFLGVTAPTPEDIPYPSETDPSRPVFAAAILVPAASLAALGRAPGAGFVEEE